MIEKTKRFFNPFKFHIVKYSNGTYSVRYLSLFYLGYRYIDIKDYGTQDWSYPYRSKYCLCTSIKEARELLDKAKKIKVETVVE